MSLETITILMDPTRPHLQPVTKDKMLYQDYECDRFADELQKYTTAKVKVVEGFLSTMPDEGIVLWYAYDLVKSLEAFSPETREKLLRRIVVMDAIEDGLVASLHRYQLAGAIAHMTYAFWRIGEIPYGSRGVHGLISVAREICTTFSTKEGCYCIMKDDPFNTLPALLVRYLEVYTVRVLQATRLFDLETLLAVIEQADSKVRCEIALKLGNIPDKRTVNTLLLLLNDDAWQMRAKSIQSLTHYAQTFGTNLALYPILTQALHQDTHSKVREIAAYSLMEYANLMKIDARGPLLQTIVQDADSNVRGEAVYYLRQHINALRLGGEEELHYILAQVQDDWLRQKAIRLFRKQR